MKRPAWLLHRLPEPILDRVAGLLELAGHEPGSGLQTLELLLAFGFLAGCAASAAVLPLLTGSDSFPLRHAIVFGLAGAIALPALWLRRGLHGRQRTMSSQFPQVLDLLVVALSAGHGFESSVQQVTRVYRGPLIDAFDTFLARRLEGVTLQQAMEELASRTGLEEADSFVTAVLTSREMGTSLIDSLRSQSERLRQQRMHRAEEEARKTSVKILLPLTLCILPVLLILLLGPVVAGFAMAFRR